MSAIALPIPWRIPEWIKWGSLGLLGAWISFTVYSSNVFQADIVQEGDYFICRDATDCNAGFGSGWSTGSPSNDGLSKSTPWECPKSLDGGGVLVAGDVVIIGDGTYTWANCGFDPGYTSTRILYINGDHGTEGNPIVIRAENPRGVIFDTGEHNPDGGLRTEQNGEFQYGIYMRDCSWIEIRGLQITGGESGIAASFRLNPCHDLVFDDLEIYDTSLAGIVTQLDYYNITISNGLFYDVVDNEQIYGPIPGEGENHQCIHNHHVYLNGWNHTVTNSIFHSSDGGSMLTIGGACNFDAAADPVGFTHLMHVYNNTFDGNGCVANFTEQTTGDQRWNAIDLFNRAVTPAFCTDIGGNARNFKNVEFRNNLFLGGNLNDSAIGESQYFAHGIAEVIQDPPPASTCTHWPWDASCHPSSRGDAGYLNFSNNTAETETLNSPHQASAVAYGEYANNNDDCTDCAVRLSGRHDYTPLSSSTDICGQGDATYAPTRDYNGNVRSSPPSVGAIECP